MQRILITGAAGQIGKALRSGLHGRYRLLRLLDIAPLGAATEGEEVVVADIRDMAAMQKATAGIDCVVHLAGQATEAEWEKVLPLNIEACYNVFEAARRRGVARVVFASSNHAVGFYPRHTPIGVDATVRPDSRYGVSKAFGEALGALYADKYGLRVLCLRIGNVGDRPLDKRRLSIWIKPEDLAQLCRIGLEHPDLRYEIFYAASFSERSWWDNSAAYAFGYRPTGRAEDYREEAMAAQAKLPDDPIGDFYQGGSFCSAEFGGDSTRAWKPV